MLNNASITLFNKYLVDKVEMYNKTPIVGVQWEDRKAANVIASGGNIAVDQSTLYIPMRLWIATYKDPKEWQALPDKTANWTLQIGDIIVKRLIPDNLEVGFTITDLKKKYDYVMTISSVDTFDMGSLDLRHWKVGLK